VDKLPGIDLAINSLRFATTGYSPFFLNTGWMPCSLIWDSPDANEYPDVCVFANKVKNSIMHAHDCILAAHVKQMRAANQKRWQAPFVEVEIFPF
jgi:hypothetical protein